MNCNGLVNGQEFASDPLMNSGCRRGLDTISFKEDIGFEVRLNDHPPTPNAVGGIQLPPLQKMMKTMFKKEMFKKEMLLATPCLSGEIDCFIDCLNDASLEQKEGPFAANGEGNQSQKYNEKIFAL